MTHTEFAVLDDEELLAFTLTQTNSSNLEIELAQRLGLLLDMVDELQVKVLALASKAIDNTPSVSEITEEIRSRFEGLYEQDPRGKSKRLC